MHLTMVNMTYMKLVTYQYTINQMVRSIVCGMVRNIRVYTCYYFIKGRLTMINTPMSSNIAYQKNTYG